MRRRFLTLAAAALALIAFGGPQIASAADFAKATYRGKPAKCPKGTHFSLRHGGECWACPSGTHRTVLPIAGAKACERRAYSTWRPAKKRRRNNRVGQGCPKGQFWSVKGGKGVLGACYSCPRGYHKSIHGATSKKACRQGHEAVFTRAKFVTKHGCPAGSFHHLGKGAGCYSCPRGWHRTVNSIRSRKACTRQLAAILSVDGAGLCKTVLGAVRAGATGAQKLNAKYQSLTAPLRKPIEAVMHKVVPPITSPKALNKLFNKAAVAMRPYKSVQDEVLRVGKLALRHPGRFGNIVLNPRLMCEGSKREIIRALVKAGLNPHFKARRAGLMDGLLVKSAHAETNRTFHAIFISSGTRKPGKVGFGIGVSLITDLRDHVGLYYSLPTFFYSRFPGYEFTAGYMIFPWTNAGAFEQINNLGVEISIGRGQRAKAPGTLLEKVMNRWPGDLGINFSFDPDFVRHPKRNIPGIGVSWGWGDGAGEPKAGAKAKSLSPSASVDYSFRLRR